MERESVGRTSGTERTSTHSYVHTRVCTCVTKWHSVRFISFVLVHRFVLSVWCVCRCVRVCVGTSVCVCWPIAKPPSTSHLGGRNMYEYGSDRRRTSANDANRTPAAPVLECKFLDRRKKYVNRFPIFWFRRSVRCAYLRFVFIWWTNRCYLTSGRR